MLNQSEINKVAYYLGINDYLNESNKDYPRLSYGEKAMCCESIFEDFIFFAVNHRDKFPPLGDFFEEYKERVDKTVADMI